ncbi:hypothetical protein HYH02_011718 [Chlamydomonas schloesseri]|uniref:Lactation elevated 1 n=1 Tax=Chlamydomonas schloesseri TaxID=2026947 RepID=A0A835TBU4_9CHLO|nr:hypothetical protein HYH02_011718 [Chlamydomonas schloesseri]|eukprot:KAG2436005.1 hypothetical protein HYH02_011718 [Chlamydomonas schloesseri]
MIGRARPGALRGLAGVAWPRQDLAAAAPGLPLLKPPSADAFPPPSRPSLAAATHSHLSLCYSSHATLASSLGAVGSAGTASLPAAAANPVLSKYRALLEDGTLKPDEQQAAFVQRLGRLYEEVVDYRRRMDEHAAATAEFQARRLQRLQQLLAAEAVEEEAQRREREAQPDHPERCSTTAAAAAASTAAAVTTGPPPPPPPQAGAPAAAAAPSVLGWLKAAVASFVPGSSSSANSGGGGSSSGAAGGSAGSARERARRAAVAREERLQREVGPPPVAPTPPRGLYVWGSVGSGKSMLVSLFYQALQEGGGLGALRWGHFNALMLEVHARLHALDTARWKAAAEREAAAAARLAAANEQAGAMAAAAAAAASGAGTGAAGTRSAAGTGAAAAEDSEEGGGARGARSHLAVAAAAALRERAAALGAHADDDEEEDEADEEEAAVAAAAVAGPGEEVGEVPLSRQGVLRHWDPRHDPEVRRQREARAAMLAVRRHMRLARLGRNDPRSLAAANASQLTHMAAALIRGRPGDPHSGWAAAAAAEAAAARSGAVASGGGGGGGGGAGLAAPAPIASALFFDEVQVTDVFSAVALKGLVEALTAAGCVLVATSNRAPEHLPRHGLHEAMWGHFVETLLQRCEVVELSSPADYRRLLLEQGRAAIASAAAIAAAAPAPATASSAAAAAAATAAAATAAWPPISASYLHPAGPAATAEMERLWRGFTSAAAAAASGSSSISSGGGGGAATATATAGSSHALDIPVMFGRSLPVRRASPCGGAAWFGFAELCSGGARPLGAADYCALAGRFGAVFVEGVRDQARRFITLIDELYNARCILVASAEVAPEQLFVGSEGDEPILDLEGLQFETAVEDARLRRDVMAGGAVAPVAASPAALAAAAGALGGAEERFAFRRAVSRLLEMQSPAYIRAALRLRQQQGLQGLQQGVQQGVQGQGLQQGVQQGLGPKVAQQRQ